MADSAIGLAIDKLVQLLTLEVKLLKGVHKEVAGIRDELEIIRAFLKDADSKTEKEGISEGVKAWVKQAREVAYCIEDVIDKYVVDVSSTQHRDQHGFMGFLCSICSLVKRLKPRHEIASDIQDIMTTLQEIKDRSERFRFISSAEYGTSSSNGTAVLSHDPRDESLFIEESELVGIESPRDDLIRYLVGGTSQRTMISLVGMGGIGKTTLAKKVYDSHIVKQHFGFHAWITVSQSYDKEELLRGMLKKFYEAKGEPFPGNIVIMDVLSLIHELREYLRAARYFVVFDDVWKIGFWGDVEHALFNNDNGSRILFTTRNEDVANFCKRSSLVHVHHMKPLLQQEAWELFCKKAFKFEFQGNCLKDLEELSHNIVRRCEGLPLAIVAIGGLLATKKKVVLEWKKLFDNLGSALTSDPHVENVTKILLLSYNDLPNHLKSCFLYFGMFPEDFSIRRSKLIKLWVAEGFVQENQGMTLEEKAEEYLTELIHRSLVQLNEAGFKGILRTCRVHDLVRDIILSKSEELNFCHISKNCSSIEGIARRLSISKRGIGDNISQCSITKSHTRSVMVFDGMDIQKPLISAIFSKFKLLTMLDFENYPIDCIPEKLGNLLHLRYLSLKDAKVSKLPKSICKLCNLETLDLSNSFVDELPVKINKFPKLRHLLGVHKKTRTLKIRGSIGDLEVLQTLHRIKIDHDVRLINELQMLKQLRKLGITDLKREHGSHLCIAIEKMAHMQTLSLFSINKDEILEVQAMSSPPPHLQSLYLNGKLQRLPFWISKLDNLATLGLFFSRLMDDPIKVFQVLPNLKSLDLLCGYDGEKIHFEEGGFHNLKWLSLSGLSELNTIIIEKGALPLLQELAIGACPQLREVPSGIQHLKDLKQLSFAGMPDDFTQRLSCDGGQDYWIVKHIPFLQYDGTYDPKDETSYAAEVKRFFG